MKHFAVYIPPQICICELEMPRMPRCSDFCSPLQCCPTSNGVSLEMVVIGFSDY